MGTGSCINVMNSILGMRRLLENMPAVANLIRNEKFIDESGSFPSYN